MKSFLHHLRSVLLILTTLLFIQPTASAYDVIIKYDNGVASSNGSFVGNVWTPTATPSILSYTDLITQLNAGDVVIGTGATAGNISFEEFIENDESILGYDFSGDHTLTLNAAGNITIDGFGIAPVLPANTGKLNINIVISGVDHDLVVSGQGLLTNGGNISVAGAREVSTINTRINTQNDLSERGSLDIDQSKVDFQLTLFQLADVAITATDTFQLIKAAIEFTGQVDISAAFIKVADGSLEDTGPIDATDGSLVLTATDSIGFERADIKANDELKFVSNHISLTNFLAEVNKNGFSIDATGEVMLSFGNIEMRGTTDAADIQINGSDLCMQGFQLRAQETDNQTDFTLVANTISLYAGNIESHEALDGRNLTIEAEETLTIDAYSLLFSGSDASVSLKAGDFIYLNDTDKDDDCFPTGNDIRIVDGNGIFELAANEIEIFQSRIFVSNGNGKIDIEGTEKLTFRKTNINVVDNSISDFNQNEINYKTKVLQYSSGNTFIESGGIPGVLTIIASDSLWSQPEEATACIDESFGGGSIYVRSVNQQPGTINVQAGYTHLQNSAIYIEGDQGDLNVEVSDSLKLISAGISNRATHTGNLSVNVEGDIFLSSARIRRGANSGTRDPNATGDLNVKAHSIFYPEFEDRRGAGIESFIQSGNVNVMAEEEITFNNGSIHSRQANGSGNMMISAQKIDLEQGCIYMTGSTGQLKIQAEDIDLLQSDFYNRVPNDDAITNSGPLFVAGKIVDLELAAFTTSGGDIDVSFQDDINLTNSRIRTEGGQLSLLALEGAINVINEGDDLANSPNNLDGLFTGNETTNGGDLSLTACTGIDIQADLNTGMGAGGSFTTMGMPISTVENRRFPGTGNINLAISETCTMLMVDIEDPCDCFNPANIYDGTSIRYFYEVVTITGANDDTWVLTDLINGAIYDENGVAITDLSALIPTTIPNGSMTDYIFTFWHEPSIGYDAIFEATEGTSLGQRQFIGNSCDGTACDISTENLPVLSNRMLFLFGGLLLGLSIFLLVSNSFKLN